jgi:diacylglycerol kinase (ATP)
LLRGLSAYASLPLQLSFDGRCEEVDALVMFACIGSTCGGGMQVAPDARSDDGLLNLTLIRYLKPMVILRDIRRLFDGTLPSHPKVSCWQTTRVALAGPAGTAIEADGEPVGHLPAAVSILPAALRVVLPG